MNKQKIKAVFYDLDNTLYPQVLDVQQRVRFCIKEFSLPKCVEEFWITEWLDNGPKKTNIIDNVIDTFSLKIDKSLLLSAYRSYKTSLSLDKDVRNMLIDIRRRGIKQFLITNGQPIVQLGKINSLGLSEFFDNISIAVGSHAKPCPHLFLETIRNYGLESEQCLSVGDWYEIDGVASIDAGIYFLHIEGGPIKENLPLGVRSIIKLPYIEDFL